MELEAYFRKMQSDGIIMSYKGAATGGLISSMVEIVQNRLADIEPKLAIKKKVFSILIEILQNIYHHFEEVQIINKNEDDIIMFVLARSETGNYYINSGNYMSRSHVPALQRRIDETNALSRDELKEKYRQVLNNGNLSDKGGAGLGIIDIARKSGNKLEYNFNHYNDNLSFFSLTVHISGS